MTENKNIKKFVILFAMASSLMASVFILPSGSTPAVAQSSSFAPKLPKTEGEKTVYKIYKQSLEADRLFGQQKYAEAIPIYEAGITALTNIEKRRSPSTPSYQFPIGKGELSAALNYGGVEYSKARNTGLDPLSYSGLMTKMLELCCQITGSKTSVADVFIPDDERLVSEAYRDVYETHLPVPDNQWAGVVSRLEIATAKIAGVLKRNPELQTGLIDRSSYPNLTGTQALAEANKKLIEARPEMKTAEEKMESEIPELAQHDIDMAIDDINKMISQAKAGDFLPAREADLMVGDRTEYLKTFARLLNADYQQAGKAMPDGAPQPLIAKLDALKAAVNARAPLNSFPLSTPHDAVLEASLRSQVARNNPQARVLKTAMIDSAWEITKNDLGIPLYRRKSGFLLSKLPQEKWARLYRVTFKEDYAGGGRYAEADGADTYGGVRWQKVP